MEGMGVAEKKGIFINSNLKKLLKTAVCSNIVSINFRHDPPVTFLTQTAGC